MADKVTFRGAVLKYFDARNSEGGAFIRMHCAAEVTDPVMEAMEWADPGESVESANLEGELNLTTLTLTPTDKKLKQHELRIDAQLAFGFQIVAIVEKEKKRRELRFQIRSADPNGAAKAFDYLRLVWKAPAAMTVSYSKQEDLPIGQAPVCVSCENEIDFKDETKTTHVNGQRCKKATAPAAEAAVH